MFDSSSKSAISSILVLVSNVRKDAEDGIVTATVTTSAASRSVVVGRVYDHEAGSFVLTMV